jgi:hypothetical protein
MKLESKKSLGTLDVGFKIILKWIFKEQNGVVWTGLIGLSIGTSRGLM